MNSDVVLVVSLTLNVVFIVQLGRTHLIAAKLARLTRDALSFSDGDEATIHVLRLGFPVCGFSNELPARWPTGHRWAREAADATCPACKARLQA